VLAGLLIEPLPGLGLTGGFDIHREPKPKGGFHEGDRIPGGDVDVDKRWADFAFRDAYAGFYLDATVLGGILSGLRK
jgi:hypothetical protein